MAGPMRMGGKRPMDPREKVKKGTLKRFMKMVVSLYKWRLLLVLICLLLSSLSSVAMSVFLKKIVDDCIVQGLSS